jgi:RNA polymerase sigma-70 factor (ECF subfamily)
MAEGGTGTRADFERWVEPHLTALARYAGRRAPTDRDEVVQRSLIRAYQRWSTYDASRSTPVAWLLGIVANECRGHRIRQHTRDVVELVDRAGSGRQTRDIDLERAVEGLPQRERLVVDLHYFVGVDIETVAQVVHATTGTVEATLLQARERLRELVGDDGG